ncbi:MAG TPA: TIGR02186 family protein [Rhizomicrobium sp.]|nr:TIGR02186 family protein [Rhizomicrobium sp.]
MTLSRALLLAFLAMPVLASAAQAEDLVSGVSQDTIQITSNYTGTDIVVFGAIERPQSAQGRNIVVVVRGPDQAMTVRRRNRIAGVWINSDAARFEGMPAYYYLASTEPVARIAPPDALSRYGIGLQALKPSAIGSHHDPEPFRQAAIRHLRRTGLYVESPGSIDFLSETLFRTKVPVPAGATRGQYNVEVYLFRDGDVVSAQSTPFFVDATGLERRLFNMAHNAPLAYGLACVAMAMLLGWISAVLFRRPD